ncbi:MULTISPECIES: GNAT family N-acetyltransferase [unclassified Pseudofrankia]|uniref:GNAT family N-acetyltransferase n=1 Tax=unclassified Pseudofrankia TaxID=2994372 RepID=UPI0008D9FA42|nr:MULTISPECIES: GNAT family N-acetyltransferase [unclassified Pseudofrankia]MDT3445291.1 GNAT family N-acetyltransferase [Pseudofrankia sp. BMG5.37]OHV61386.1 acetyltransferase [Pseudofrankia sp. BMG5.36]
MASADIRLVRWTPARMRARLDEVIAVYKAAFLDVHEADPVRAARDRMTHARRHTERRDLRAVAALTADDVLVGITYATPGRVGQWWHDVVASALSPAAAAYWLEDCLEIVELHVLPDYQGQGIGRALLRELLRDVPHRTAALSALELPDSRARQLYASEGFVPLLSNFRFPGSYTPYGVLGKELPPPASQRRRGAVTARFGRPARAL